MLHCSCSEGNLGQIVNNDLQHGSVEVDRDDTIDDRRIRVRRTEEEIMRCNNTEVEQVD